MALAWFERPPTKPGFAKSLAMMTWTSPLRRGKGNKGPHHLVSPRDGLRGRTAGDAARRPRAALRCYRGGVSSCAFCAIAAGEKDQPVVAADEHTVAFLDVRPVFKGHVLVIPRVH